MGTIEYRGQRLDSDHGALIPDAVAEEMVESISTWVPMPLEVLIDSEYLVYTWERIRLMLDGLPAPSIRERIVGRQTVEGPSGYEHDFDITWRTWAVERWSRVTRWLDPRPRIGRWVHDRWLSAFCPEEED